ncbi:hydantoinase/oxoprolinase family protein [Elioraea rosea]|uniref:hydantoinase/oxoprolinase family protein n=1 Tax=Elioraea rosea TaxID=2492390 RepID=UPI001183BE8F|nr:hydantoinase/oxoprolinase family protein [Elioraea rosea]
MYRIGVDVGGTFTDFTVFGEAEGRVWFFKVPSTPHDPSEAIQLGVRQIIDALALDPKSITHLGHGTTVATNMIIERRGVPTGLLTTKGFRDALEVARQVRPNLYDYGQRKPEPLVDRFNRLEVNERIGARGEVVDPLDRVQLDGAVATLRRNGVQSVAICFMHSYRNPAHEAVAKEAVQRLMPDAFVSVSSEVLPEFREYERMSTTVLNAYVGPRMRTYLDQFLARMRDLGIAAEPYTIHSNGGLLSARTVAAFPVRTCLSGPAAGVVGAAVIGAAVGARDLVTFDVGGTSTDVSLIKDGRPLFTSNRTVAEYPVKSPMIDIHVIGAGGGSIGWLDDAGALKVGPRSAGAVPGPAAYDRGGTEATLTDANIVMRRLNPEALLRGRMPISYARAHAVIEDRIARPLGISVEAAAHGMVRIANANMSRAIRSVSTERGHDLSKFALFAFGGAGALHGAEVARECGIGSMIVPQEPGTMCARGVLLSPLSFDYVRSEIMPAGEEAWRRVCEIFRDMWAEGSAWLDGERVPAERRAFRLFLDARYLGQNHEVVVPMPAVSADGLDDFLARFRQAHEQEYGYAIAGRTVEIVNCRLQAIGDVPQAPLKPPAGGGTLEAALIDRRDVYFGGVDGFLRTPIYDRDTLPQDATLSGPAIIEEMSSTLLVLPGQMAALDTAGNIHVRKHS